MAMTLGSYLELLSHALGKTPDPRHRLIDTLNRAGRALTTAHDWKWLRVGPVSIQAVAGQNWLDLPADFSALDDCFIDNSEGQNDSGFTHVQPTSMTEILRLRQCSPGYVSSQGFRVYFPFYNAAGNPNEQPVNRAMCFPTPTENSKPTIWIIYRRRWRELLETQADVVPNIDPDWENALISIACSMAHRIENLQSSAAYEEMYATELMRLISHDSTRQQNLGLLRGGAGDRTITMPQVAVSRINT